ncbi:MAG: hypothetical protein NZ889_02795 [Candidatus Pacearchaeota archaeon]|nr:hypothetical protein [Candidatus Pacearchaeota archaeon]
MRLCILCKKGLAADVLQVCASCIKNNFEKAKSFIENAFERTLRPYTLPPFPPNDGIIGDGCENRCKIKKGKKVIVALSLINKTDLSSLPTTNGFFGFILINTPLIASLRGAVGLLE